MRRATQIGLGALGLLAAEAAVLGYAVGYEPRAYTLRRVTIPVLPAGERPMRVLHLSDLHLTPRQRGKIRWVSRLAGLQPDLVVCTGDLISHHDAVPSLIEAFGGLLDVPGVFVRGSNDYFAPSLRNPLSYLISDTGRDDDEGPVDPPETLPWQDMTAALEDCGWVDMDNDRGLVKVDGRTASLVGVDDPHIRRDRYALVAGAPGEGADVAIGVAHAPYQRILDAMTDDGFDLILAGHTHGGQVCVPGWGALVTNCDLPTSAAKGLTVYRSSTSERVSWLHVSAGLGTSPFAPIRVACRPEASLLTLVAVTDAAD
jgi:uncharacterized protein